MKNPDTALHTRAVGTASEVGRKGWTRRFLIGLFIALGCLALTAYVVVHWAERQIFTTDNWVALVAPLPKQPVVSDALGSFISEKVFTSVPVEQKIADALPPKAAFLAGPLSDQLKNITTNTARRLVAGDAFQTIWAGANRIAMNRLVTTARGQTPPLQSKVNQKFDLDISGVSTKLQQGLGKASTAIPALQPAANKPIDISADLKARPQRLRQVVRATDTLAVVLPLLVMTCFLVAMTLSMHRRKTALILAITVIIFMLAELVAIKLTRQEVLNQVKVPSNIPAITYIYDQLVDWLRHMIFVVIGVGALFCIGLLLGGPANWAVSARQYMRFDRIQSSRFMRGWREARVWTGQWKYYAWVGFLVLILISLATFVTGNARSVLNAALLYISLCCLVQIIASPPARRLERARK